MASVSDTLFILNLLIWLPGFWLVSDRETILSSRPNNYYQAQWKHGDRDSIRRNTATATCRDALWNELWLRSLAQTQTNQGSFQKWCVLDNRTEKRLIHLQKWCVFDSRTEKRLVHHNKIHCMRVNKIIICLIWSIISLSRFPKLTRHSRRSCETTRRGRQQE